ncbi:MAG: 3'-5' exoribonuclease YhaM family protein [Solirubrobacterales bacterium]
MPTIAELEDGTRFTGRFACGRKDRMSARNGSPYLALELRDRTGALTARAFNDVDRLAARFEAGDAVEVTGKVVRFRGDRQLEVSDVRRLDPGQVDPAEFLPAAYRSVEELEGFLEHLAREIHDPGLAAVVRALLFEGPIAGEFRRAPCTRRGHHAYLGGLLEHTVAVGTLVGEVCQLHPRLDSDLLMAAALLHDIGKTREFRYAAAIELTDEGRLIGHLNLGAQLIAPAATALPDDRRVALMHCVLAHHGTEGRQPFGSAEAAALHRLNALDATVKDALEHGLR